MIRLVLMPQIGDNDDGIVVVAWTVTDDTIGSDATDR